MPDTELESRDKLGSKSMGSVTGFGRGDGGRGGVIRRTDKQFHRFMENYYCFKFYEGV